MNDDNANTNAENLVTFAVLERGYLDLGEVRTLVQHPAIDLRPLSRGHLIYFKYGGRELAIAARNVNRTCLVSFLQRDEEGGIDQYPLTLRIPFDDENPIWIPEAYARGYVGSIVDQAVYELIVTVLSIAFPIYEEKNDER